MRWAVLAAAIAAYDAVLARAGGPLLSHDYWSALEDPDRRWLPVAGTATILYHLNRPRRAWLEALLVGATAGTLTRVLR